LFLSLVVLETHLLIHPSPGVLNYFPSAFSSLLRFQLLALFHKLSIALTLSLEHLAPLYTPPLLSSTLLARVEGAAVNALGESNHLIGAEIGQIVKEEDSAVGRREAVEKLKSDIVESLIADRAFRANTE
jgi:hypothetical protein